MPKNLGREPTCPLVDIRYRNGAVVRGVVPATRRWTLDDPAFSEGYEFDIAAWQPAEGK